MWAVIPFKRIQRAKQRLASVLSAEERQLLSQRMLEDVLDTACQSKAFEEIVVATNCEEVIPITKRKGALNLKISQDLGLNHAAGEAAEWLCSQNIESMCLFPADIPLANDSEFRLVVHDHIVGGMTIIPSHDQFGTNCLVLSPPNLIPFCFGKDSYFKHLRQGLKLNLAYQVKFMCGIALDIDTPKDLKALVTTPNRTLSQNYLEKIQISSRLNQLF